ncbi:MAG TPA: hypothetical protein VI522_04105 [Gammaproteobacteria bacterium]|nr:hypothetical protein [Gammaproteobacteria bacterium]
MNKFKENHGAALVRVEIKNGGYYVHKTVAEAINDREELIAQVSRLSQFASQYLGRDHVLIRDAKELLDRVL